MKIAILGNSHVAAVKLGLSQDVLAEGLTPTDISFYALPRRGLGEFMVRDNKLVTDDEELQQQLRQTSGGLSEIDPSAYDIIILHGLGLRFDYSLITNGFVSVQAAKACLQAVAEQASAFRLYTKLLTITDKPIGVSLCPLLSDEAPVLGMIYKNTANPAIGAETFFEVVSGLLQRKRDFIIRQPETTRSGVMATKAEFCHGSTQVLPLDKAHPKDDFNHMNGLYGAQWWQCLWPILADRGLIPAPATNG